MDPAVFEGLSRLTPPMIYLVGVVVLWKKLDKAQELHTAQLVSLIDRYEALLGKAIEALTKTAERLDDIQKRP